MKDLIPYVEPQLLGPLDKALKTFIRRFFYPASREESEISLELLPKLENRSEALVLWLVRLRMAAFFIPTLILYPKLKPHIYFQAEGPA